MNTRVLLSLLCLSGCAQAPPSTPLKTLVVQQAPLSNYFRHEPAPSNQPPATPCLLGTSCMTLDSRPFEVCQVGSKSCGDKPAEFLFVDQAR